jgi:hypothetical protein
MNTNFRWFTVAVLSAVAVLPVRAQVQVQNTNFRGGNGVNYVRAARSICRPVLYQFGSANVKSQPVFCGAKGREDAISYARRRAGYAPTEIQVLDGEWSVVETISPEIVRGLI